MNFLAHLFLSGEDEELLLGNFIADSVKGKQHEQYKTGIARGIRLHRLIDTYTDTHALVRQTKERLRPVYRKFAPVIADMYYDHFLASGFHNFSKEPLEAYATKVYALINANFDILPARVQHFFPYMVRQNWLLSYAEVEGITQALRGMSRRTSFVSGMETAGEELHLHYNAYASDFHLFFPELISYVERVKEEL